MWDFSAFFVIFVGMWIIVRKTYAEVSTIVGFYFDFIIPLQCTSTSCTIFFGDSQCFCRKPKHSKTS